MCSIIMPSSLQWSIVHLIKLYLNIQSSIYTIGIEAIFTKKDTSKFSFDVRIGK
jgi:hypothetical protein